jgi:hypothetical protein
MSQEQENQLMMTVMAYSVEAQQIESQKRTSVQRVLSISAQSGSSADGRFGGRRSAGIAEPGPVAV